METEHIDKLFLELSQFTKATTKREADLTARLATAEFRNEQDAKLLSEFADHVKRARKERDKERGDRQKADSEVERLRGVFARMHKALAGKVYDPTMMDTLAKEAKAEAKKVSNGQSADSDDSR